MQKNGLIEHITTDYQKRLQEKLISNIGNKEVLFDRSNYVNITLLMFKN